MAFKVKESFRDALVNADLISAATVACVAGAWVKLGERVINAGEGISLGYGAAGTQETAVGRIYIDIKDGAGTPAAINGKLRLSQFSPQGRPGPIIGEYRTNILSANPTDRTKQLPFPEHGLIIQEDQKIVLEFLPDTTATLTKANCTILMDITSFVVSNN